MAFEAHLFVEPGVGFSFGGRGGGFRVWICLGFGFRLVGLQGLDFRITSGLGFWISCLGFCSFGIGCYSLQG